MILSTIFSIAFWIALIASLICSGLMLNNVRNKNIEANKQIFKVNLIWICVFVLAWVGNVMAVYNSVV